MWTASEEKNEKKDEKDGEKAEKKLDPEAEKLQKVRTRVIVMTLMTLPDIVTLML